MKRIFALVITFVMVYGIAVSSHATLINNLDGTVTDDTTGLMWLQDANLAATNGYAAYGTDAGGTGMGFDDCIAWVTSLNSGAGFANHTDWRMPTAYNPDGSGPTIGYAGQLGTGEMLNLSYIEGVWKNNPSPFINIMLNPSYWTSTSGGELGLMAVDNDDGVVNYLSGGGGSLSYVLSKLTFAGPDPITGEDSFVPTRFAAWAVRDAGLTAIPEPTTIALLAIGLAGLGGMYLRRRL